MHVFLILAIVSLSLGIEGKTFERCALAKELIRLKAPKSQVATWVCIAYQESRYNTRAVGSLNANGSKDHGIFQINDRFWCSPPGRGKGCGMACSKFEDDDISNDYACVQKIFKEHQRLSGNGFNAWTTYKKCNGNVNSYIAGCNI